MVGSIALDTVETPRERRENLLGGSVSYACASASFFTSVGMVGVVGDDFPARGVALYERLGIDMSGLAKVRGKTFRWSGRYEDDMTNRETLSTELNVFASFSPELPDSYRQTPFILLGNIAPDLQLRVLSQARNAEFVVADTMDLWINTARVPLMRVIEKANMLMLNDSESRLLTNEWNLKKCAADILSMGPQYVVIKKGEHGAMLVSGDGIFAVPAYPVDEVRDPTGAGDSFAGAFLGALAGGGRSDIAGVKRALLYGSAAASFTVEGFSLDRLQEISRDDIERRHMELKKMMSL